MSSKQFWGSFAGGVLIFLSLGEAPEQLAAWKRGWDQFVAWVLSDSNGPRWLFGVLAALVGLWAWDVHKKIAEKLGLNWFVRSASNEIVVDEHFERLRDLLRDAAQFIRDENATPAPPNNTTEIIRRVWTIHSTVPALLEAALRLPTASERYRGFLKLEKEKRGEDAIVNAAAWFLNELADELRFKEVDHSFVLPNSFKQYRDTENWPKHHEQA